MKDNVLKKFLEIPDKDEVISKLILGVDEKQIHEWLKEKYGQVDKKLVLNVKELKQFKDEYLNLYNKIREDAFALKMVRNTGAEVSQLVSENSTYKSKLNEYLDKEIDIKSMVKNMIIAIEHRASQVFDTIQQSPDNFKFDRVLIEWFNALTAILEKYDAIINGSPDKIIQQNNINIQILDQHIGVFHKVIRDVLQRLDYDTSMLFIDLMNEELKKLKLNNDIQDVDFRLGETKKLQENVRDSLDE